MNDDAYDAATDIYHKIASHRADADRCWEAGNVPGWQSHTDIAVTLVDDFCTLLADTGLSPTRAYKMYQLMSQHIPIAQALIETAHMR